MNYHEHIEEAWISHRKIMPSTSTEREINAARFAFISGFITTMAVIRSASIIEHLEMLSALTKFRENYGNQDIKH